MDFIEFLGVNENTKKYEMVPEGKLFRITLLRDIGRLKRGTRGGLIESEKNLSHDGGCWVDEDSTVTGNAVVMGNSKIMESHIYGSAMVDTKGLVMFSKVYGDAKILHSAEVISAEVSGKAVIKDTASIDGGKNQVVTISENAVISGSSIVAGQAVVRGNSVVTDKATVSGKAIVAGDSKITERANVSDESKVLNTLVSGGSSVGGSANVENSKLNSVSGVRGNAHVEICELTDSEITHNAKVYESTLVKSRVGGTVTMRNRNLKNEEIMQ